MLFSFFLLILGLNPIQAQITVGFDVVEPCLGFPTGMITALPSGGVAPYEYLWSTDESTQIISNLPAGTYSVTVADANGATGNASITIEYDVLSVELEVGGCEAPYTITAHVFDGEGPFWYDWSTGEEGQTITVEPGYYCITLTDNNKCAVVECVTIDYEPLVLDVKGRDIVCTGNDDGELNAEVTGGAPPYTYLWSNTETTQIIRDLTPGNYTVTVTDARGCTISGGGTVADQPPIILTLTGSALDCQGDTDGTVRVVATGGAPPYQYLWSNNATTATQTGLPAGNYSVTVTDADGCTAEGTTSITQPPVLLVVLTPEDIVCGGEEVGNIRTSVTGGTAPYTYLWSDDSTGEDLENVRGGTYTVTVTDDNGCFSTASATIEESATLAIQMNATPTSCFGLADGSASVTASGGTGTYTYLWSNDATTSSISSLTSGVYRVTVTDINNCEAIGEIEVTQPAEIIVTLTPSDVACAGETTGGITSAVSGGVEPYSYLWSDGPTAEDRENIPAGTYFLMVTDQNGCSSTASATINEPAALTIQLNATPATCFGTTDGSVSVIANGGTGSYTYLWSNDATTPSVGSLGAGTYRVTVTDANGCAAEDEVEVAEPAALEVLLTPVDVACAGDETGGITTSVSGGTAPYTYLWSDDSTGEDLEGAAAGTYAVTVTDQSGCISTASATINQSQALSLQMQATPVSCFDFSDGAASVTAGGGAGPYAYLWSNAATTESISDLSAGTYRVTVTDVNNCEAIGEIEVLQPAALIVTLTPSDVACAGEATGGITSAVSGGAGPYAYLWSDDSTGEDLENATAGAYTVIVTDNNGCISTASATIDEPAALTVGLTAANVLCANDETGSIRTVVSGGTGNYSYLWSDNSTGEDLENVTAGLYAVTVTDQNGCAATASATVNEPAALLLEMAATPVSCTGFGDGTASVEASGGVGPYEYSWSNDATTDEIGSLDGGIYRVTVTDVNGCTAEEEVEVTEPDALTIQVTGRSLLCNDDGDGLVSVDIQGGTPGYQISWSNGSSAASQTGLPGGRYDVTVTDARGCTATDGITLSEPDLLEVTVSVVQGVCDGASTGELEADATGGTGPYSFEWRDATGATIGTNASIGALAAGSYTVIVTDANQCEARTTFDFVAFENPFCQIISVTKVDDFENPNGSAEVEASGGLGPYTFLWSDPAGQTTARAENLAAGTYTVTVTDRNGCTTTCEAEIQNVAGIGDLVWEDNNRNGLYDPATEDGFEGVEVKLKDAGGTVIATTTTDENGHYAFLDLEPGTYSVMFVQPPTYEFADFDRGDDDTIDSDADPNMDGMTANVTIGEGEYNPTIDAGLVVAPVSEFLDICNCLNNATNEDNGQFLEAVLIQSYAGETWRVINISNMFTADSADPPVAPTPLTEGTVMDEITPGEYQLRFKVVDDLFFTGVFTNGMDTLTLRNICVYPSINVDIPEDGLCVTDDPLVLRANPTVPGTVTFTLNGETVTEIDPAELGVGTYELQATFVPDDADECEAVALETVIIHENCLAMVGDFVWLDRDRDGIQDAGELGIPGVEVIITSFDGTYTDRTFTGVDGRYKFTVPLGVYKITFVKPAGMTASPQDAGSDDEKDSDADPDTGMTDFFTLTDQGVNEVAMDFSRDAGFYSPCENIDDPGEIGYDQRLCGPGGDPEPFVSIRDASGGEGEIVYLWMMSTQDGPFDPDIWQPIPNSNTPTYDPGPLYYTTYFARCARREDCITFLETNIVKVVVNDDAVAEIGGPTAICKGSAPSFISLAHGNGAAISWELQRQGIDRVIAAGAGPEFSYTFGATGIYYLTLSVTENNCTSTAVHRVSVTTNPTVCGTGFTIDATAMDNQQYIKVEWRMQEDVISQDFTLEYATDGETFQPLSEVKEPAAVEGSMNYYEYVHAKPKKGWNYYRVRLDDGWGNTAYSDVAEVVIYSDSRLLITYPNPVRDELVIELFDTFNSTISIEVFNLNGIRLDQMEVEGNLQRQTVNFSNYPAGAYFIRVRYGEADLKVVRVIKE